MPELPPLNALRAFEVAARTGSFVQAGAELGVSAAAVSQQVKLLETHLGKQLFVRQGNRIMLSDAGRTVYPAIQRAFEDIAALSASIREGEKRSQLVISVLPSMAELWLLPRLARFQGDVSLELRIEDDPVAFSREGVDLRVTYGGGLYADHRVETLFSDRIVALCSPTFRAAMHGQIADLPDTDFIHTDWGPAYATQPSWPVWMAKARCNRFPDPARGLRLGLTSLAIAAARQGMGVTLAPEGIAADDLQAGRLVRASKVSFQMPSDYVLVYPNAFARRKPLMAMIAHLKATI